MFMSRLFCLTKSKLLVPYIPIAYRSYRLILIYTETNRNQKYLAIRITYNYKGVQKSWNIAIRRCSPTAAERNITQASELLIQWMKGILLEFEIVSKDIISSSTDSGSDVKRTLEVVFKTLREWCLSNLNHLALSDAFGTSQDPKKSKNKEARKIVRKV